ncbi:uncharacterized protein LOC134738518 [Pongo pygmaeus]|uniref:uncharacterized protein LOC134738518 n=1 Tax=Pongo pygmaeus TaxID=9600 RepID=UPI00300C7130
MKDVAAGLALPPVNSGLWAGCFSPLGLGVLICVVETNHGTSKLLEHSLEHSKCSVIVHGVTDVSAKKVQSQGRMTSIGLDFNLLPAWFPSPTSLQPTEELFQTRSLSRSFFCSKAFSISPLSPGGSPNALASVKVKGHLVSPAFLASHSCTAESFPRVDVTHAVPIA